MERISGPYKGFYIAAYSVQMADGHVGYAKVCAELPGDVWSVSSFEKLATVRGCRSELDAIAAAERKAREVIGDIIGEPVSAPAPLQ